jgi:hypothetical protein
MSHPDEEISLPANVPMVAGKAEDSVRTSFMGSRSVVSFQTISDLYSGSEHEDDDLEEDDGFYGQTSSWIDPDGSKSDTTSDSPKRIGVLEPTKVSSLTKPLPHSKIRKRRTSSAFSFGSIRSRLTRESVAEPKLPKIAQSQKLVMNVTKVRRGFAFLFVSLLADYRDFIQISPHETDLKSSEDMALFDSEGFLADTEPSKRVGSVCSTRFLSHSAPSQALSSDSNVSVLCTGKNRTQIC